MIRFEGKRPIRRSLTTTTEWNGCDQRYLCRSQRVVGGIFEEFCSLFLADTLVFRRRWPF